MALTTDPDFLVNCHFPSFLSLSITRTRSSKIYQMRQAMLKTQEAVVERIITLPNPSDNDYISAYTSSSHFMTSRRTELQPNGNFHSPRSPEKSRGAVSPPALHEQAAPRERSVARRVQQEASTVPIVPSIVTVEAAQARMAQALHFGTGGDQLASGDRGTRGRKFATSRSRGTSQTEDIIPPETHAAEAARETLVTKGPMSEADPRVVQTGSGAIDTEAGESSGVQASANIQGSSDEQPDHAKRMAQIETLKKRLLEAQQRSQSEVEGHQSQAGEAESKEALEATTPKSDSATDAPSSPDVHKLARSISENGRSKSVSRSTSRRRRRASSASTSISRRHMEHGSIDEAGEDDRLEVESITDSLHDSMRQAIEEGEDETDGEEVDDDAMRFVGRLRDIRIYLTYQNAFCSHASHSSAESMHVDDHLDGDLMDGELTVGVSREDGLNTAETIREDAHEQAEVVPAIEENTGQTQYTEPSATTKPDTKSAEGDRLAAKPSLGPPRLSDENLFAKKGLPTLPPKDNSWKRKSGASLLDFGGSRSVKPISALSALIADKKGNDNPFAAEYSFFVSISRSGFEIIPRLYNFSCEISPAREIQIQCDSKSM